MTEHASLVSLERRPDGVALITIDARARLREFFARGLDAG
jgi:hypothetical protein